jgi:hypothetical protein
MEQTEKLTVRKEFVLMAHSQACRDWKKRIEDEFPSVFPKGFIGRKGYPVDNSYCIHAVTGQRYEGVGPAGNYCTQAREVTIISEPYEAMTEFGVKEFVTVLDNGEPFRVLNIIEPRPREKKQVFDFSPFTHPSTI